MRESPVHPVTMVCHDLKQTPEHAPPASLRLRWYQPGDEAHWVAIHQQADLYNETNLTVFWEQFGEAREQLPRRQCYLWTQDGQVVGTATAWYGDDPDGKIAGRVHWVAIRPDAQGRGLGKVLLSAVCIRMDHLGHTGAYLTTDIVRVPALNLYWQFGFVPALTNAADAQGWTQLLKSSGEKDTALKPAFLAWLRQHL